MGKKQLAVQALGTLRSVDYGWLAQEMTKELKKTAKDETLVDWILPKFSTTTTDDTIVGSVLLMATMKKYFYYKFCCLSCGIPQVTLAGTVEDWENIHARVDKLKSYGKVCSDWASMLSRITAQFVETSKGNIDVGFWSKICHYSSFGSGSASVSGWISAFCVFNEDGKWQGDNMPSSEYPVIDSNDIAHGYLTVDVLVDDNGVEYKTLMFAGHMGYETVDDRNGIAPKLAY